MDHIERLAHAIDSLFQEGIRLGDDVMHYMDSACGIDSPGSLEERLLDPHDSENQTLCELIFFPDESQQVVLEPIIEAHAFSAPDETALAQRLIHTEISATLILPNDLKTRPIPVPGYVIAQFVRRLKIARAFDDRIIDAISTRIADTDLRMMLQVRLRNSRFAFSNNVVGFLEDFLARLEPEASGFLELFEFSCEFLEGIGPKDDTYTALMDRKRLCAEMIRQAKKSEKNLREQPVEALIMKGITIACMGEDEARREIDLIDRISRAIYGRTEFIESLLDPGDTSLDLGDFQAGGKDMEKVVRIFS